MANEIPFFSGLNLNNQKVINVSPGTSTGEVTTFDQLYDWTHKTSWKNACRLATTVNINLSNPATSTFDSTTAANNDRILVKNQTAPTENGLYVFNGSASAMTRVDEVNASNEIVAGMTVIVTEGTLYHDTMWMLTTNPPYVMGTTGLTFELYPATVTNTYRTTVTAAATVVVTHNLGTRDVLVQVYRNASPWDNVFVAFERTSTTQITLYMPGGSGDFNVLVQKI